MIRSCVETEKCDFKHIIEKNHINIVYAIIEKNFDKYFENLKTPTKSGLDLSGLEDQFKVKKKSKKDNAEKIIINNIERYIEKFESESEKYKDLFDNETMQEFLDDAPEMFKTALVKKCPVIRRSFNSKREVMKEWQKAFKLASSKELLGTFSNLLDFADEYSDKIDINKFKKFDEPEEFGFEPLDKEVDYSVPGVIGMGIKSIVLYYLYPQIFPKRSLEDLYGLYFLTEQQSFGVPTDTSEFIMINDTTELWKDMDQNYKIDQNYWYPYSLFSLYAIRLYRLLKDRLTKFEISLDPDLRFIYVSYFLSNICAQHEEDINAMLGGFDD